MRRIMRNHQHDGVVIQLTIWMHLLVSIILVLKHSKIRPFLFSRYWTPSQVRSYFAYLSIRSFGDIPLHVHVRGHVKQVLIIEQ
jgi:hypothetical protein